MKIMKSFSGIRGTRVVVKLDEGDSFFDGWIKHGASELGITGHGIRYVIATGDIYYNLDDAFKKLRSFHNAIDEIQYFCHGISGDQIKDLRKRLQSLETRTKQE